ncbi:MAG TPA: hypothetical protein VMI54_28265 [Polyangiaceae bacterium]|nr:hypothetical protein [Polyangiaceae bacterium]
MPPGGGYPPGGYGPPGGYPPGGYGPPGYGPPGGMGGGFTPPPGGYGPPGAIVPGAGAGPAWTPLEAIGFGWNVVMKHYAAIALPIVVGMLIYAIPTDSAYFGGAFAIGMFDNPPSVARDAIPLMSGALASGVLVVALLIGSFIFAGMLSLALKAARGQPTSFGDVFAGGPLFVQFFVGSLLFGIAYTLGAVLCIVPGIFVAIAFSLFPFLIIDQGLSGVDALKQSWEMTKGHRLNIFLFWIVAMFVYLLGSLACGLGALFISAPVIYVAMAWVYLRIKGEAVPQPA